MQKPGKCDMYRGDGEQEAETIFEWACIIFGIYHIQTSKPLL